MSSRISRALIALMLATCVWTGGIAVMAAPQSQDQQSTQQKDDAPPVMPAATPKPKQAPAQPTASASSGRPLSTSEDPSKIGKRKINSGFVQWMSMSLEKEVAFGRQLAAEVDRQAKFIEDPLITEYVNRVGQNIVLHSDAKVPFTIKVIDTDEVNAFALPGGFFYVNKGLILAADNEAELASVMAHEISHVAARHTVENMARANIAQYGMIAGAIVFGLPPILYDAAQIGLGLGFLKFNRNAEEEADKLGLQYLYASGYDPNAMATMFEKLFAKNKKKPGFFAKLVASHPQPPNRRQNSIALAGRFPDREEYVVSTSEFQRVKGHLLRLSNARVTTAGDITTGRDDNGTPGRPTLKRRQPAPDDTSTSPDSPDAGSSDSRPSNTQPSDPPKLKRRDGTPPSTDPGTTP